MKILFFLGDLNLKDSIFDSVLADSTCVPKKDLGFSLFLNFQKIRLLVCEIQKDRLN
ncbi:hypothetical protein LEP1GSC029_1082 [Leptospira interrogans str. 2002000626]|uniref:Uncharacterized protein n=1 Tax=Leptospira interrogans str. 2002000626 TaxID=996803 RepID=A0A829D1Q5_LEPIR|nr:hypothetical protein LEP1GSC029_1082 [Leptospira interrogans str. 2002000626]